MSAFEPKVETACLLHDNVVELLVFQNLFEGKNLSVGCLRLLAGRCRQAPANTDVITEEGCLLRLDMAGRLQEVTCDDETALKCSGERLIGSAVSYYETWNVQVPYAASVRMIDMPPWQMSACL